MNRNLIFGIGIAVIISLVVFISFQGKKTETIQKEIIAGQDVAPTTVTIKNDSTVPLPQETDIIRLFVNLIDEGKVNDAVMMMSSKITNDDSTKQAFGVQYAAMTSVKVKKIEDSSKTDWTDSWHQYMIILDVVMDQSSADGPIPYYGFEQGENVRFINLVKEGNQWKIEGLSTGP